MNFPLYQSGGERLFVVFGQMFLQGQHNTVGNNGSQDEVLEGCEKPLELRI